MWKSSLFFIAILSASLPAREIPGGLLTGGLPALIPRAHLSLAPGFRGGGAGAYLTSRLSLEPEPGLRTGMVFGSGMAGFHFGAEGEWEVFASGRVRGAFGISSVFQRDRGEGFFSLGASGTLSRAFFSSAGVLVPFVGAQVTPSFALGKGTSETGVRPTVGLNWDWRDGAHTRLWVQWGYGLMNAHSETVFGISYPFATL